jgi:hypothetical protein
MNLSIIGNPEEEGVGRRTKAERQQRRTERKEKRKDKPSRVKKVLLAIPRNAFLGLIRLNFRGLATRLNNQNKKDPAKVKAMWLRLGGNPERLLEPLRKGALKKRLLGVDAFNAMDFEYTINGVSEPATAAALLASAAPIIAVVSKFLKNQQEPEASGENLDDIQPAPGEEIDTATAASDPETPEAKAAQPTAASSGGGDFSFSPTTGLLIGGGLLAAFFLFKKKK